jgi:hypothetical protein
MAMAPDLRQAKRPGWVLLLAGLLYLPLSLPAADDDAGGKFSRDPADKAGCQANLNFIFEAIREYRKQHQGELPPRLSNLADGYVHDPKILICPFVQRTGGLRSWRKEIRELDLDPLSSYGYEFPRNEIGDDLWRGLPKRTWREYKERQVEKLGKLGGVVPIVRCHFHRPRLNLAFDGRIYESDLYWEKNYQLSVPEEEMAPARLFADPAGRRKVGPADFPQRDPRAPPSSIDLSAHYNGLLEDSWQGFPSNHLARLPSGLQKFGGVLFDVRGVIQLRGIEHELPYSFPEKVAGINVNQKLHRIHFLQGTSFDPTAFKPPQTNVATYVVHYADNQTREIPIIYGQQIADWWDDPKHPSEPTDAKVAWTGYNEAAARYGKYLRIYQSTWENPLSGVEVASISFVSGTTISAPFLIAITIQP